MLFAIPIVLFFVAANAQISDNNSFSLFMTGECKSDSPSTGNCTLKGNSQTISTLISTNDVIKFFVKDHIGSFALLTGKYVTGIDGTVREVGSISFGVHKHREHSLSYTLSGQQKQGNGNVRWLSSSGTITGGLGVYEGYEGIITAAGGNEGERFFGLVSGHIWKK